MKIISSKEFKELAGNPLIGSKYEAYGEIEVGQGFFISNEEWLATGLKTEPFTVILHGSVYKRAPNTKFRTRRIPTGWVGLRVQ